MDMGDEGAPHGVDGRTVADGVKPGSVCRPVPPMTAICTGSLEGEGERGSERIDG